MIIRFLKKLFSSCNHVYEIINIIDVVDWDDDDAVIGHKYVLRCKKCGKIKVKKNLLKVKNSLLI